MAWWDRGKKALSRELQTAVGQMGEQLKVAVVDAVKTVATSSTQPAGQPGDRVPVSGELLERVEALERRMEQVHGECLRFLQSASQRLKRAEDAERRMGEDDDGAGGPPRIPPEVQRELDLHARNGTQEAETDEQYMDRIARERGFHNA